MINNLPKYKTDHLVIAIATLLNFLLHVVAGFNSGFHGDELLHIEAGRHLATGYMDFPPVIAFMAFLQNLFGSDSLFINHITVYLASAAIFILSGLTTMRLGGKTPAVFTIMICLFFSPGISASHALFLPVIFEQLAWVACLFFLVSFCNQNYAKYIFGFAVAAAFGFLSKYSIAFLIGGLGVSVLFFRRDVLKDKSTWPGIFLFAVLIFPNIIWQIRNGFPVFHHFSALYETQLDKQSRMSEINDLLLILNPFTAFFWIPAVLITPFLPAFKKYRLALFTLFAAFILLFAAKGKSYYYFPVILTALPAGAVLAQQLAVKRKWILTSLLVFTSIIGFVALPFGVPVLPLKTFISVYHLKPNEDGRYKIPFENYYSKEIWNRALTEVETIYTKLPEQEKQKCLVWGRHYSQAGGINLLGEKRNLPKAFSFHSSFYNWVPDFEKDATIIVIADPEWDMEHWQRFFSSVEEMNVIENYYTQDKKWYFQRIFLCRGLKNNSAELKAIFKDEIY